jgi:hypothetical protein
MDLLDQMLAEAEANFDVTEQEELDKAVAEVYPVLSPRTAAMASGLQTTDRVAGIHVCVHTYAPCMYVYAHQYDAHFTCIHTYGKCTHAYIHICIHRHIHTYVHAYIHT